MMTQDLEKTLWATADKLRNNMDAAEYKHIVLGLIFLKYISDSFEDLYNRLKEKNFLMQKIKTSIWLRMFSMCHLLHVGITYSTKEQNCQA